VRLASASPGLFHCSLIGANLPSPSQRIHYSTLVQPGQKDLQDEVRSRLERAGGHTFRERAGEREDRKSDFLADAP